MLLSNPMTWKLPHMVVPGKNSIMSPEYVMASMKFPSPVTGSSKRYDNDGIGLGIVAALEKSGHGINPVCYPESGWNGTDPVRYCRRLQFATEIDHSEEYTCVTTRDGVTKVYYNDDDFNFSQNHVDRDRRRKESMQIAEESPAKKRELLRGCPDFLTTCYLCKKKLQGKDIYMYKGDEGFCSKECRSVKIMEDSLTEQHKLRSVEVLSSSYAGGEISSAGIFVI